MKDLEGLEARRVARGVTLGAPLTLLAETASTNDDAKRGAQAGAPSGALWVADAQTRGRGRQGRAWTSSAGKGLLFSLLLRVDAPPARLPPAALACGLAVRDAVAKAAPAALVRVKWPNDVVVGEERKKLAGVLVESAGGALVIGVGVNVHFGSFPEELRARATCVADLEGACPDRAELLVDILAGLETLVPLVLARGVGPVQARLAAADALFGARLRDDTGRQGRGRGFDCDGQLVVERDDGTLERWFAGEVHLV